MSWFSWYWPTSLDQLQISEQRLFRHLELKFHIHHVPVSTLDFESKKMIKSDDYINTITVEPFTNEEDFDFRLTKDYDDRRDAHQTSDIVLAHGYGCGLGYFYKNIEYLASGSKKRVHAIDWLGMGGSSRPQMHTTADESNLDEVESVFVESLEEWRRSMKINKMILIGHSLGGYLSTLYTIKYPQHVEKLILASPVGILEKPPQKESESVEQTQYRRSLLMGTVKYFWERNLTPQSVLRFFGPYGPKFAEGYVNRRIPNLTEEEAKDLSDYLYHISAKKGSGEYTMNTILSFGAWARRPLINRIHNVTVPTDFLYGEMDWMDPNGGIAAGRKIKSEVNTYIIDKAGHNLYIDNPQAFNETVMTIIKTMESQAKQQ